MYNPLGGFVSSYLFNDIIYNYRGLYALFFIYVSPLFLLLYLLFFYGREDENLQDRKYGGHFILLFPAIVIALVAIGIRYIYYPGLMGFDPVFYYIPLFKVASTSFEELLKLLNFWRRPLFVLIILVIYLLGVPLELIFILLPVFTSVLYVISSYYFISISTNNKKLAWVVSCFVPLSFFYIRMSWDLLSNFLAMVFMFFFLAEYVRFRRSEKRYFYFLIFGVGFVLIHPWTAIIFFLVIFLSYLLEYFLSKKTSTPSKMITFLSSLLLLLAISSLFIITYKNNLLRLLNFSSSWHFGWYWMFWKESPVTLTLALIGFFFLVFRSGYKLFNLLLLSWVSVLSILLWFPFAAWKLIAYRIIILYPMGILQGLGVYYIIDFISERFKLPTINFKLYRIDSRNVLAILLLVLVFVSFLPNAIIHEYVYRPDDATISQLREMAKIFGYNNESNIYLIYDSPARPLDPRSTPNVVGWIRAHLGLNYYEGHFLELLSGLPSKRGNVYDHSTLINKTLVFASRVYSLSPLELSLTKEILEGIYILRVNESLFDNLDSFVLSNSVDIFGFNISSNSWHITTRTLKASLRYIDGEYGRMLRVGLHYNSYGWLTLERKFDNLNGSRFQGFILGLLSNASNVSLLLEGYYKSGRVYGRKIVVHPGVIWVALPIKKGEILSKVRLAIYSPDFLPSNYFILLKYFTLFTELSSGF